MIKPTIHTNGTSPESLRDSYTEAFRALTVAQEKLGEATPNGRDYYPQGDAALTQALDEHKARLRLIDSIKTEMLLLAEHCDDIIVEREKRRLERAS